MSSAHYAPLESDDVEQQDDTLGHAYNDDSDTRTPLDKTIDRIGMGSYQWTLLSLCGFGWMADNMWIQAIAIILPRIQRHYSVPDNYIGAVSSSMFAGMMVGAVGWGTCSDLMGRSAAFNATLFFTAVFGLLASFADSFSSLCVVLFLLGSSVGGSMPTDGTLLLEHMPKSKQYLVTALSVFFSFGAVLSAVVALFVLPRNSCTTSVCDVDTQNQGWKYLLICLGVITFSMFLGRMVFFRLHESPRYLVHAGRPHDAIRSLQMISKFNGSDLSIELADVRDCPPITPTSLSIPTPSVLPVPTTPDSSAPLVADPTSKSPPAFPASDLAPTNDYASTGESPPVLHEHTFTTPTSEVEGPYFGSVQPVSDVNASGRHVIEGHDDEEHQDTFQQPLPVRRNVPSSHSRQRSASGFSRRSSASFSHLDSWVCCRRMPRWLRKPLSAWWDRVLMVLSPEWIRTTLLVWCIWWAMSLAYTMFNVFLPKLLETRTGSGSVSADDAEDSQNIEKTLWDVVIFTVGGCPGAILGAFLIESKLGRRWSLAGSTFITAFFCIVFVLVESTWAVRASTVGISLSATVMWAVLYGWTPEVFGTKAVLEHTDTYPTDLTPHRTQDNPMSSTPENDSTNGPTQPPEFNQAEAVNVIELDSVKDSKILSVSVYSGRAEVTRLFKFNVKTGQNQLNIEGLPWVLDQDSLRVEGRGSATIHDVTVSRMENPPVPTSSPTLKSLISQQRKLEKAFERAQKSITSLEAYLSSVKAENIDVSKLSEVVENYEKTAGELDDKVAELEEKMAETRKEIEDERNKLSKKTINDKLNIKASIGIFADFEGEIKIALIYGVDNATWTAGYDVRVDMQTKEKAVTLVYKAGITQSTGEDWNDVPLTLETATPTFGLGVPSLTPWTLSIYRPPVYGKKKRGIGFGTGSGSLGGMPPPPVPSAAPVQNQFARMSAMALDAEEEYAAREITFRGLNVSSKGNVNATFGVPGLITIPSDDVAHNVTIVKLSLDATMSWVSVPKQDAKTHLKAKIKNASEYTLLAGTASVYVDGSFISKSEVPLVSPDESFDCPLGLDPSVRITYHPRSKKVSQSGFYTKTISHTYQQRITVFNSKSSPIQDLKIVDQVPISEDALITVKLVNPNLSLPGEGTTSGEIKIPAPVKVQQGVVAQWDGADESDVEVEGLGKDGKFNWVCSVPAQGKVNLLLHWEVTAPVKTDITGL